MAVRVTVYGTADMKQISAARAELERLEATAMATAGGFVGHMSRFSSAATNAGKAMVDAGSSLTRGLTVPLGIAGAGLYMATQKASDFAETTSKVGVIFDAQAAAIEDFGRSAAQSMGMSQQAAMDAAAQFAIFGKSAGLTGGSLVKFSTDMTKLASDMASFANTTPDEAIMAIGAALRGEMEPIRKYGVMLDDASLKQQAMTMGIYNGEGALTQQQKVLAAQAAILAQTGSAQGDFARTSDGLANQQRIMQAELQNTATELGTAFLPIMLDLVSMFKNDVMPVITDAITWFKGLDEGTRSNIVMFGAFAAAAGPLLSVLGNISKGVGALSQGMIFTWTTTAKAIGGIKNFADGLTNAHGMVTSFATPMQNLGTRVREGAIAVGQFVASIWAKITALAVSTGAWIANTTAIVAHKVATFAVETATKAAAAAQWLLNAAMTANPIGLIIAAIAALVAGLIWFFTQTEVGQQMWAGFVGFLTDAWANFTKWIGEAWANITQFFTDAITNVVNFVRDHWGLILSFIIGPLGLVIQWVVNNWGQISEFIGQVWDNIVSGISSAVGAVFGWFRDMNSGIRNILSGAGQWLLDTGRNIVEGLWNGIKGGWTWLTDQIGNLVDGLVGGVKDMLGIRSPSRVFAQIGQNVSAGMAQGITASAPLVEKALDKLAMVGSATVAAGTMTASLAMGSLGGAPAPSLQLASSGSSSNSVVVAQGAVQITIQGDANASDVQAVVEDAFTQLVRELRAS